MALGETKGIILFTKDFKEKDKLVKNFLQNPMEKLMFFCERRASKKIILFCR